MKKKKRRLKLPFRILRTLFIVVLLLLATLFGSYKYFIEDDLNNLIDTYEKTIYNKEFKNNVNTKTDSYTIAILGVDEDLEYSRTDSINLMAVNPSTNEVKLYSVPRDTYINYECIDDYSDKITNAHSRGGVTCTLDALENVFNTKIDFYVKIDFSGFITIIDQLGTIETEVPDFYEGGQWCEQTANREDEICFTQFGKQRVNSEQALAIARSRQHSSDIDRNSLQTQIISDIIKEMLTIRDIKKFEEIVVALDSKVETNIDTKQSFYMAYNMYKFNKEGKEIETMQLDGVADYIVGNYVGYGSYFVLDTEGLQKTREDLEKFLKKQKE